MNLLPDPEDGGGLFGESGSESGLFDQAPATLPRGFEISETEQSGNYEGVLYRRDSGMDGLDDVVRVQEIDGRNEVYAGVDDGDEANLNPTYFEDPDQFGDPFELAARTAEGTFDPLSDSGGVGGIEENIRAAESAGALFPEPNGDAQQAPDGLFSPSNDGGNTARKRQVDVQSLDSAGEIRERYAEYLHPDDHRGRTTVQFVGDVPDGVVRQARAAADETAAERARSQSTSLTEREREQIKSIGGFTQSRTTANWRSAKGVFEREGLGSQFRDAIGSINDYDDPIEGAEVYVERHKARQAEARVGGVGAMDVGETDIQQRQRAGRAAAREQQSLEASAIEGAKRGHQEAVDALVLEAGWDRAEAEALGQKVDDPRDSMTEPEFQRIVDAEIKRSSSSGRFAHDPQQTTLPGVERRRTSGRFVSSPLADTDIGRNTETGRFVDRGDR